MMSSAGECFRYIHLVYMYEFFYQRNDVRGTRLYRQLGLPWFTNLTWIYIPTSYSLSQSYPKTASWKIPSGHRRQFSWEISLRSESFWVKSESFRPPTTLSPSPYRISTGDLHATNRELQATNSICSVEVLEDSMEAFKHRDGFDLALQAIVQTSWNQGHPTPGRFDDCCAYKEHTTPHTSSEWTVAWFASQFS